MSTVNASPAIKNGHSMDTEGRRETEKTPAKEAPIAQPRARVLFQGQDTNLGPEIQDMAKMRGDQSLQVRELVEAYVSNAQTGHTIAATVERDSAARTIQNASRKLRNAYKKRERIPPQIVEPGSKIEIGGLKLLMLSSVVIGVLASLWLENTASATMLIGFEVFNLTKDSMWLARTIMFAPIGASMTGLLALRFFPNRLRNIILISATVVFAFSAVTYCVAFAYETQRYRDEALQPFAILEENEAASANDSSMAIVLLACLSLMMLCSPLIAHSGLEVLIENSQLRIPNPKYLAVENEIAVYEKDIEVAQDTISMTERKLAVLKSREAELVTSALALYKRLKMNTALLLAMLLPAWGATRCAAQQATNKTEVRPAHRVIAVSPQLTATDRAQIKSTLTRESEVMLTQPLGHVLEVVDGWTSQPIAKIENTTDSSRTRRRATAEQLKLIYDFIKSSGGNETMDGRVHLPRLAHSLGQSRLPARTHVVVVGSPLFVGTGQDALFNMTEGRYPNDGCLFDKNNSVFSTVGKSKRLESQFWHLGWNTSEVADEAHKSAVLRFWGLYLAEQSASLVTGQPSISAAIEAANKSATNKLVNDQPDRTSKPGVTSKVWRFETEESTEGIPQVPEAESMEGIPQARNEESLDDVGAKTVAGQDNLSEQSSLKITLPLEDHVVRKPQLKTQQSTDLESKAVANPTARDKFKNLVGSSNDLVQDQQISGKKITILSLCDCPGLEDSPLYCALEDKGFTVEIFNAPLPDSTRFAKMIETTDQLWIFSSPGSSNFTDAHANCIINRWSSDKLSLCLLADNAPYFHEANRLLALMSKSGRIRVSGDYHGAQYLRAGGALKSEGFDPTCPLFFNVETLFEGITISSIESASPGLQPVCWASNGKPLVATYQFPGKGRLIVHCGFTSFFSKYWTDAGVRRLAVNSAAWLSGIDRPGQKQ